MRNIHPRNVLPLRMHHHSIPPLEEDEEDEDDDNNNNKDKDEKKRTTTSTSRRMLWPSSVSSSIVPFRIRTWRETEHKSQIVVPKVQFKEVPIPAYLASDKFDLKHIDSSISTYIHMNILDASDDPRNREFDVSLLRQRQVRTIVHRYQDTYASDVHPTGFGDFIRSCFFVLQFCRKYRFGCQIVVTHPIAVFLEHFGESWVSASPAVPMFTETNWSHSLFDKQQCIQSFSLGGHREKEYIQYLCAQPINPWTKTITTYNILFPYDSIIDEDLRMVQKLLEPSIDMLTHVGMAMDRLGLVHASFVVIHIRSGDDHLIHGQTQFAVHYVDVIKHELNEVIFNNKEKKILLIADNNEIKALLQTIYKGLKCLVHDITHLGEGVKLQANQVKNTLLDFYLMSHASAIYSYTAYPHGSGFSYWCAKLYGIPYRCKYIK